MQTLRRLPLRHGSDSGKRPTPTRGFTLVELLVVIVVIGILAAIAIPVFLSQADKASDTALKSDLANAAKLLQVAEANGETLPSEFAAGEVVELGTAGTFTASETLTVTGSGETLCVEGVSDSGNVYSADVTTGLKNRDCSGWSPIQATGGDRVYTITVDGIGYRVHEFTTVGESTFTITDAGATGEVEYLVVGGGGGGGGTYGRVTQSGGGGGGLVEGSTVLPGGDHVIDVGAGGAAGRGTAASRYGQDSTFNGVVAMGGGVGGNAHTPGGDGGSGGGSGYGEPAGQGLQSTSASGGYGFDGTTTSSASSGGGGGGAGGPGVGKNGGPGHLSYIRSPLGEYFAGGGGGRGGGIGGVGGGGDGGAWSGPGGDSGTNGLGGGGGSGTSESYPNGGAGGSGIIIIRYPLTNPI